MTEYGMAMSAPLAMPRDIAEYTLRRNFEYWKTQHPELADYEPEIKEGPEYPIYEEYEDDDEGNRVGIGPPLGWNKDWGWYVDTETTARLAPS